MRCWKALERRERGGFGTLWNGTPLWNAAARRSKAGATEDTRGARGRPEFKFRSKRGEVNNGTKAQRRRLQQEKTPLKKPFRFPQKQANNKTPDTSFLQNQPVAARGINNTNFQAT